MAEAPANMADDDVGMEDEKRDTIPAYIVRAAEISPKHRLYIDAHYPRMIVDEVSPTHPHLPGLWGARRGDRRMSDPGRLSVSPCRVMRPRIGSCVSEQHLLQSEPIAEESLPLGHPRLQELRTPPPAEEDQFPNCRSRPREKSLPAWGHFMARRQAQRSMSLPCSDQVVLEVGEAIGALAIRSPTLTPPSRRRRSVSIEPNSLEAIAEEGGLGPRPPGRRYSTSHVINM